MLTFNSIKTAWYEAVQLGPERKGRNGETQFGTENVFDASTYKVDHLQEMKRNETQRNFHAVLRSRLNKTKHRRTCMK
jgi:hypothetical protein